MTFSTDLLSTALDLLGELGETVQLGVRLQAPINGAGDRGGANNEDVPSLRAVIIPRSGQNLGPVQLSSYVVYLEGLSLSGLTAGDLITFPDAASENYGDWRVLDVKTYAPQGLPILHELGVER